MITVALYRGWDLSSDNLAPDSRFSTVFPELPLRTAFAVGPELSVGPRIWGLGPLTEVAWPAPSCGSAAPHPGTSRL